MVLPSVSSLIPQMRRKLFTKLAGAYNMDNGNMCALGENKLIFSKAQILTWNVRTIFSSAPLANRYRVNAQMVCIS